MLVIKKRKNFSLKKHRTRLKLYEALFCYFCNTLIWNHSSWKQQLASSSLQHNQLMLTILTVTCLRKELSAQPSSILDRFSLIYETKFNYKSTQTSLYDSTELAIHSLLPPEFDVIPNCGDNFKKTVSFNDMVHLIDEENTVTKGDPDSGKTFHPEYVNWKRRKIEELVINPRLPKTIRVTDPLTKTYPLAYLWTLTNYKRWVQQLCYHSIKLLTGMLWSFSAPKQQLNTLRQFFILFIATNGQ